MRWRLKSARWGGLHLFCSYTGPCGEGDEGLLVGLSNLNSLLSRSGELCRPIVARFAPRFCSRGQSGLPAERMVMDGCSLRVASACRLALGAFAAAAAAFMARLGATVFAAWHPCYVVKVGLAYFGSFFCLVFGCWMCVGGTSSIITLDWSRDEWSFLESGLLACS